jgi:hypothetical protein
MPDASLHGPHDDYAASTKKPGCRTILRQPGDFEDSE